MGIGHKSWTRLEAEITETFRRWRALTRNHAVESEFTKTPARLREATKPGQTLQERRVTLRFTWWDWERAEPRDIVLAMEREERAIDNLRLLAQAIEWMRTADVRGITNLVVKLHRQMYPQPARATPPPTPPTPPPSPAGQARAVRHGSPYATLHLAEGAPLEVAEAAYKVLVRQAHPDSGGTHAVMVALNTAIEQIRADKARG